MSQRVIRYEGEGKRRRPVYADEGPATAAATSPIAMLERGGVPGHSASGGAGPIERRQITDAQRAARDDSPPVPEKRPGVIVRGRPAMGSPEHVQQSRMNGARRHVEVLADRRPTEEEPPVEPTTIEDQVDAGTALPGTGDDQVATPASTELQLEILSTRAQDAAAAYAVAVDAQRAALAAVEAWETARDALEAAWSDVQDVFVDADGPIPSDDDHAHYVIPMAVTTPTREAEARHERLLEDGWTRVDPPAAVEPPSEPEPVVDVAPTPHQVREATARAQKPVGGLTPRQAKVLELLQAGKTRREVADELHVVYQTVDNLLEAMARKGQLPHGLIPKLPARFAKFATVSS